MKMFRLLRADEIECRISQITENGLSLLLYKTARTDADLLDETVGSANWENDFKLVDGVLYGGIGVRFPEGTVWKWDAGTESNTEAEKGRASDAFKRAGFKFGLGRELYSAPQIKIYADKCNIKKNTKGKPVCYDNFEVAQIGYDEQERINQLVITCNGKPVYELGKPNRKPEPVQEQPQNNSEYTPTCVECGEKISVKVHDYSAKKYGKPLCMNCQKKQ